MGDRTLLAPGGSARISGRGLVALFFFTMFQFGLLDGPRWLAEVAGRHGWLALAGGALWGFIVLLMMLDLARRFPGQTLYHYSHTILGAPLAFVANGLMILYTLLFLGFFLNQFNQIVQTYLLPRTPAWAILTLIVSGVVLALSLGPLALSRLSQLLMLPVVAAAVIMLLLTTRNVRWTFLRPLWPIPGDTFAASLTVGFIPFIPIKHLPVQLALVQDANRHRRSLLATYGGIAALKVAFTASTLATFGEAGTRILAWPSLEALRLVQVPQALLEEAGLPGLVVFQVALFVAAAVYFATDYVGIAVWLRVGPRAMGYLLSLLALLAVGIALLPQNRGESDMMRLLVHYGGYYVAAGYPLVLWVVARLRRLGVSRP